MQTRKVLPPKKCVKCASMEASMAHYSNDLQGPLCKKCVDELTTCVKCGKNFALNYDCMKCNKQNLTARMFHPHNGRHDFTDYETVHNFDDINIELTQMYKNCLIERYRSLIQKNTSQEDALEIIHLETMISTRILKMELVV